MDESKVVAEAPSGDLRRLTSYFLKLGTLGFGGPAALVGYMRRDLVEQQGIVDEDTFNMALALAQIMPGPLAAQVAIAIGYFQAGVLGATLVGAAFVLPSFLMVLGLSIAYVAFGGLPWMQALFYGIGAAVISIIAVAAYRLALGTNKRDHDLWVVFSLLLITTALLQAELAALFIVAGLSVMLLRSWPGPTRAALFVVLAVASVAAITLLEHTLLNADAGAPDHELLQILIFFTKAGAFVFGSGLAIVPFLQQGVVEEFAWLTEHEFLDAVAVALITPGPVVITVAFIGYLVAGVLGASVAAVGIFLPVYVFTIVPAPWFSRHRDNGQLRALVAGTTAAASGAIAGAVIVLASRAITDVPTGVIAIGGLVLLTRYRMKEPVLVVLAGFAGLVLWPLVGP